VLGLHAACRTGEGAAGALLLSSQLDRLLLPGRRLEGTQLLAALLLMGTVPVEGVLLLVTVLSADGARPRLLLDTLHEHHRTT
jgi:hypothetical protein